MAAWGGLEAGRHTVCTPRLQPCALGIPFILHRHPATPQSGLDLVNGAIRDNIAAGVVEPALSKLKIIQFATEAAITILRIDDLIRLEPEPQEGEE